MRTICLLQILVKLRPFAKRQTLRHQPTGRQQGLCVGLEVMLGEQVPGAARLAFDSSKKVAEWKWFRPTAVPRRMPQNLSRVIQIPERPILHGHLITHDGPHGHLDPFELAKSDTPKDAIKLIADDNVFETHPRQKHASSWRGRHERQRITSQTKIADKAQRTLCIPNARNRQAFSSPAGWQVSVRQREFGVLHDKFPAEMRNPPWEHCACVRARA